MEGFLPFEGLLIIHSYILMIDVSITQKSRGSIWECCENKWLEQYLNHLMSSTMHTGHLCCAMKTSEHMGMQHKDLNGTGLTFRFSDFEDTMCKLWEHIRESKQSHPFLSGNWEFMSELCKYLDPDFFLIHAKDYSQKHLFPQ